MKKLISKVKTCRFWAKFKKITPTIFLWLTLIAWVVGVYTAFEAVLIIIFYGIFMGICCLVEAINKLHKELGDISNEYKQ